MVSTRQMSSIGGGSVVNDVAAPSGSEPVAVPRVTRHSSALLPGGSSPHASSPSTPSTPSTPKCTALVPVPKNHPMNLLELPVEIMEKIFAFVGYKHVAILRMVNRQLNRICSTVLNYTFQRLQKHLLVRFQTIKAKMPRRESARRSHPLACESDIIETLHMRLSLLQMTFGKHIERSHCCFFPGEILDEVLSIMTYLRTTTKLARPYKVTDELFDLTTMAMEYFKEHIEPFLPEITYFGSDFFELSNTFSPGESSKSFTCADSPPQSGGDSPPPQAAADVSAERRVSALNMYMEESLPPSPPPPQSNMVLRKRIHRIKQGMKKYNDQLSALRSDLRSCKRKTALQHKQIAEQQKQIAEQQKQTLEYANRLDDYDKKNEETSRKFQTLLQELNKCKTELQYWRSRSPAVPPLCAECGASLHLSPSTSLWAAGTSTEAAEAEASGTCCEVGFSTCALLDTNTELPRPEPPKPQPKVKAEVKPEPKAKPESKPEPKAKPESKPDSKCKLETKVEKSKFESKAESKFKETKVERTKTEYKTDSGGEGSASTPPTRRRASADATHGTPDRKKRRLTRPRKL